MKRLSQIPIIDFAKYLRGNPIERLQVSKSVVEAFRDVGFIYLKNHSIPQATVDSVFQHSKTFFQLDQAKKDQLAWETPESNRGYVSPGREKVTQLTNAEDIKKLRESLPDLKESLEIGKEPSSKFQNRWPHLPGFRDQMMSFYDQCHGLHLQVMNAIALGLDLPDQYFVKFCDKKDHNLRLLHYPKAKKETLLGGKATRAGAHSDYGTLTLLFQDDKGGLQVKDPEGVFQPAPPIPGTIVVNAGDLLARWSNDVIKSTDHRVVNPPSEPQDEYYPERYSVAFFCNPNQEAWIECLQPSQSNPPKYKGINAYEYLTQRLSETYV
ncbi:hypothetical protein EDD86DRAFT_212912 [Gorgonomyces haynaldii]|nr:hypothetical protein EDD86DRAFT_212912 [Gorgonomyces haynaldii]